MLCHNRIDETSNPKPPDSSCLSRKWQLPYKDPRLESHEGVTHRSSSVEVARPHGTRRSCRGRLGRADGVMAAGRLWDGHYGLMACASDS